MVQNPEPTRVEGSIVCISRFPMWPIPSPLFFYLCEVRFTWILFSYGNFNSDLIFVFEKFFYLHVFYCSLTKVIHISRRLQTGDKSPRSKGCYEVVHSNCRVQVLSVKRYVYELFHQCSKRFLFLLLYIDQRHRD